ncbi:ribonuclease HII [Vibrio pectenicida]|uniref:Ribonuclease HII n=1 Tax=Vibrio pectenicida TaxID=62763 RepID=A0A427U526_9VIBR|nr:ribonuclease HII [Vibrio pectenicida]RSD31776.1 ribonuclease HII [Vibrio pectenicida]
MIEKNKNLSQFEYPAGYQVIAGVDEVGRGPLVGDVVTAAVILDPNQPIGGLNDSKKLTEKKRLALFPEILDKSLSWAVGRCSHDEIDQYNILNATMIAMQRAIESLNVIPDLALIDGNRVPQLVMDAQAVVKGDMRVAEISAASIIAKVIRDQEMEELDKLHPEFGFAKHKGYPTKAHFEAIEKYGVIEQHRRSFKPVKKALGLV